ncbi:MAG: hypothetical protein ACRER2_08315 [Methylococcales bacterium]
MEQAFAAKAIENSVSMAPLRFLRSPFSDSPVRGRISKKKSLAIRNQTDRALVIGIIVVDRNHFVLLVSNSPLGVSIQKADSL